VKDDHECTECGKPGATRRHDDCADVEHWFHPECWKRFCDWLSCAIVKAKEKRHT
jgi:hypothetical protein